MAISLFYGKKPFGNHDATGQRLIRFLYLRVGFLPGGAQPSICLTKITLMVNQVLCIDDDVISQTISQLLLKRAAFAERILMANDGQEAIGMLAQMTSQVSFDARNAPCLIFLDLNMPEMDGWTFLDHYVKNFESLLSFTRIIILSSTIDPADALRAREYPVVIQFLHKPLQVDNLEALKKHELFHCFFSV